MNQEIKQRWVEALRSGKYKQGREYLRSKNDEFCCLGVLCDLHAQETGGEWGSSPDTTCPAYMYGDPVDVALLPRLVQKWAGIDSIHVGGASLMAHNDGGRADNYAGIVAPKSFAEIADLIESGL